MTGRNGDYRWNGIDLLKKLAGTPQELLQWIKAAQVTQQYENSHQASMQGIVVRKESAAALQARLERLQPASAAAVAANHLAAAGPAAAVPAAPLSGREQAVLRRIREDTAAGNRSNLTRTQAYWSVYRRHPELHWAYLAHMVSRNVGWNMTDLKGELLPHLLDANRQEQIFRLLERANSLIFHDTYPQLLLYEASKRCGVPLFHLLALLDVSCFMRPVWELFWERRDSALLTEALIINEQHYIEQRVIRHPFYRQQVLDTLMFHAQSVLQLNQILLPYRDGTREGDCGGALRLAGLTLGRFGDLAERIEAGKRLYALLFGIPAVCGGSLPFAAGQRHTGSRADYWPHLFSPVRQAPPAPKGQLKEWLDGCSLKPGAARLYSPGLQHVWNSRPVEAPEPGDWYIQDAGRCISYISSVPPPASFEITQEYCSSLNKIELAVLAGDLFT